MEGRTSRSLSELAEEGAGEENSLLGNKEGEKVTSLDTLVPEEEVEAPLSVNQVHIMGGMLVKKETIPSAFHSIHQENHKAGVVRRRSQRKAVTRQNTYSDGDWTDSSLSPSSRPFFSAVQSPSSSFPQASATPSLSGEREGGVINCFSSEFEDCHSTLATAPDTPDCSGEYLQFSQQFFMFCSRAKNYQRVFDIVSAEQEVFRL